MQEIWKEIDDMRINILKNNITIEAELTKRKENDNWIWSYYNSQVELEIVTDNEMKNILNIRKSENIYIFCLL